MLSKKMAVSLTSLITILALAFVVTPAMALRIELSLEDTFIPTDASSPLVATAVTDAKPDDPGAEDGYQVQINPATNPTMLPATLGATHNVVLKIKDANDAVLVAAAVDDFVIIGGAVAGDDANAQAANIMRDGNGLKVTLTPSAAEMSVHIRANTLASVAGDNRHDSASMLIKYVVADTTAPTVVSVTRVEDIVREEAAGDAENVAEHKIFEETFTVVIKLSEMPAKGVLPSFKDLKEATVQRVYFLRTANEWTTTADPIDADSTLTFPNPRLTTGQDGKFHYYAAVLKPKYENADDIKFKIAKFKDQLGNEGSDSSEYKYSVVPPKQAQTAGIEVVIPKDLIIPDGGALIVAKDDQSGNNHEEKVSDSLIMWPGDPKEAAADIALRKPAQRLYNMIEANLPDLENFLINGGTIDLISPDSVIITEIMWGTDAGSQNRQWIEITNTAGKELKTGDKTYKLMFYAANEVVPVTTTAVAATATTPAIPVGSVPAGVADRVGTLHNGAYWSIVGIGKSGNTSGTIAIPDQDVEVVGASSLVSMQRGMKDAKEMYPDGTMQSSWMQSIPPSYNFQESARGLLVGTPGAAPIPSDAAIKAAAEAAANAAAAAEEADYEAFISSVMYPRLDQGRIYISEVMFDGGGTLPQWIEISNGDRSNWFHIGGWTLTVENAAGTADVDTVTLTIPPGTVIDRSSQHTDRPSTVLIVTEQGRNNFPTGWKAEEHVIVLDEDGSSTQVDLINADILTGKYSLLSDEAFRITLAPPVPKATKPPATETAAEKAKRQAAEKKEAAVRKAATDTVGNLVKGAAAWELPMTEDGGRSSIIRRHTKVARGPAAPKDGTMAENWVLASDTAFADVVHIRIQSYYGAATDVGTPGFRPGSALPVELSHFRPTRDKATGAVVITWVTQSELNNAGFFIKRSQQRNGEFKVINATMVPGAGTTSEKQFYTYTDTTAQPNVVYYYQIEDISLDGNRQTLTRGTRLKGHIGAAGKATTLWGELKSSNE